MTRRSELARAQALRAAWDEYVEKARALTAIVPCTAAWPADPPGPAYTGTQCQLIEGHDGKHRHRMLGSTVTVDW